MKNLIQLFSILLIFSSCKSFIQAKHKDLIGFKLNFITELGEDKYFEIEDEIGEIKTKYINDTLYISFYEDLNACGKYDGNIEISNDTIFTKIYLTNDELCTSTSIDRATFIINNPDEKKRVVIRD